MSYTPRYDRGDWKCACDACGRLFKASKLQKRWDGYMVCEQDWEPRQPQDFVRGVADYQAPPWTRPEQSNTFINVGTTYIASLISNLTSSVSLVCYKVQKYTQAVTTTSSNLVATITTLIFRQAKYVNGSSVNSKPLG